MNDRKRISFQIAVEQSDTLSSRDFCMDNCALNLVVKRDKENSPEEGGNLRTKRDATEGSYFPKTMKTFSRPSGPQQTTLRITGEEEEKFRRSINITDVADKFLLGTMNALSHLQDDSGLGTVSPVETALFSDETVLVNTDNLIEYSSSGSSGITGHNITSRGQLCSPQKKSKPNCRLSRPPLLPPCRVCGDRASGYHYGVNTCEACKGFFRRSICRTEPYTCTGSGDCKTLGGKRTSCSHCRFKTCIVMGMSKTAIKTGRYTHELRSKNILEVKRLQKQESDESLDKSFEEIPSIDMNFSVYQNELLRKSLLEETLGVLIAGQKLLYEFLDDYYNDDLIRERQLSVYRDYMERKRKLLEQEKRQTAPMESHTARTELHAVQTECPTIPAECHIAHAKRHIAKIEPNTVQCLDNINDEQSRTGQSNFTVNNFPSNSERSDLSLYSSETGGSVVHSVAVDVDMSDNVRMIQLTSDNRSDITPSLAHERNENCKYQPTDMNNAHVARKEITAKIKLDDSTVPQAEILRAEVMSNIINDMEQGVQGMLGFAKCLPGFVELPTQDQASLVKAARFDIWYIGHIRCFNVELRVGACEWQFHAEELAQVWGESVVELAFTLSRVAQTLDLTKHETAALRAVCLTFPDRCTDLQNRDEVEQMNLHMLEVFKHVSCKRHTDYNKWFTKIINFLVMLREFGVKFEAISSRLKLDWAVLKDNPLLLSVFLS